MESSIKETLDALFGSLLKFVLYKLESIHLGVRREDGVDLVAT